MEIRSQTALYSQDCAPWVQRKLSGHLIFCQWGIQTQEIGIILFGYQKYVALRKLKTYIQYRCRTHWVHWDSLELWCSNNIHLRLTASLELSQEQVLIMATKWVFRMPADWSLSLFFHTPSSLRSLFSHSLCHQKPSIESPHSYYSLGKF